MMRMLCDTPYILDRGRSELSATRTGVFNPQRPGHAAIPPGHYGLSKIET